jgi:antitoxin component of MazEF toxin-antitoxin module
VRTKLVDTGEGLAVVIDSSMVDLLGYVAGTEVEARVEGDALIIEPMRSRKDRIQEAMDRALAEHRESLRKLGD